MMKKSTYREGFILGIDGKTWLIFVVVMLAVAGGSIAYMFGGSKQVQMQNGLVTMSKNIKGLFSSQTSYAGLTNAVAIAARAVPNNLRAGDTPQTPWGGAITVAPGTNVGTFQITLAGVPQDACVQLAMFQPDLWISVSVNGTILDSSTGVAAATTACTATNTLIYTAR
jgi:hypothetical protein